MASSGTLKTFLLVCMVLAAPSLRAVDGQMSCGQMVSKLTPCVDYLLNGGSVPGNCCDGVRALYGTATTTPNRQAICRCLKSALGSTSYNNNNLKNAQALPAKCGVSIPYKISPNLNCDQIHRNGPV